MMQETMLTGTGKASSSYGVRGATGGKTGTTDGGRDAWFVGFTPELVVAVWVGHDKSRDLGLTGAQAALPIWARIVAGSGRMSDDAVVPPEGVISIALCVETGERAVEACPEREAGWFSDEVGEGTACTLHSDGVFSETTSIIEKIRQRFAGESAPAESDADVSGKDRKRRRGFWRRRGRGD